MPAPPPTRACSQSDAVLSLMLIISIATLSSDTGELSFTLPSRSSPG
jgi:hypothetical protein